MQQWLTEEHELFRATAQRFIREQMDPFFLEWERAPIGHTAELWEAAGEIGLVGLMVPEEYGGPGCDPLFPIILTEEIAKSPCGASLGGNAFGADLLTMLLVEFGTEEQKRRYFPDILTGKVSQCIAISEPGAGSDVNAIACRARSDGDDFVINGQKMFISHAMVANLCYLVVKTDDDVERGRGSLTMLLVDLDAPGVERRRLETMGMKASSVAEIFFTDVRVPKSAILGHEGKGLGGAIRNFMLFDRVLMSLRALATAEYAFDLTLNYVKERRLFGKRVFDFQNTQFKLAEMKAQLLAGEAFRNMLVERLMTNTLDQMTASAAKLWCSEHEYRTADTCMQLHGGYGYMNETLISKIFTFARLEPIYGGTNEIQKYTIAKYL